MRHNKHNHTLGVTKEHRAAMLSNLATALVTHGRIKTTLAKARALRPFVEKLITKAKRAAAASERKDAIHQRRLAYSKLRDKAAIGILFDEKVDQFINRPGGYTRIYKLSDRRGGDAAELALIELVEADDPGYKKPKAKAKAAVVDTVKAVEPAVVAEAGSDSLESEVGSPTKS